MSPMMRMMVVALNAMQNLLCMIARHKRSWKHLDTIQFKAQLQSKSPRIKCQEHGVKTIALPWARKSSGFTLLFEAFAIKVLEASKSTENARKLIGINYKK